VNATPQDEEVMNGLMGKRLLGWKLVEDDGVYLTLSDGTVVFCFGLGVMVPHNRTLQ